MAANPAVSSGDEPLMRLGRAVRALAAADLVALSMADVATEICHAVLGVVDGDDCTLGLIDTRLRRTCTVLGGAGRAGTAFAGRQWPLAGDLLEALVDERRAVETGDFPDRDDGGPREVRDAGVRRLRMVPVALPPGPRESMEDVAFIAVMRRRPEAFSAEEAVLLDDLANLASVHVARARLAAAQEEAAAQQRVAFEVAEDLAGTLEPSAVIRRLLERLIEVVEADRGTVSWIEDRAFVVEHSHDPVGVPVPRGARIDYSLLPECVEAIDSRHPVITGPVATDRIDPDLRPPYEGIRHRLLIPVVVGGEVVASIALSRRRDPGFRADDVAATTPIVNVAAVALRNARLYARAAALEDIKSRFLRLASHELRGPITVARGYISMLGDGSLPFPAEIAPILATVDAKLTHMNMLVDDMLETARLEDGRLELDLRDLDLREVARRAVDEMRPLTSGHTLALAVPDTEVTLLADPRRLATIVTNLVDNAVKYSPAGGEVRCSVETSMGMACLTVEDHGIGIAGDQQRVLFTRFGRVVTPENSHIPGSGLGLHLARELARLHGGDIVLASAPGKGTTVRLTLPLRARPASL